MGETLYSSEIMISGSSRNQIKDIKGAPLYSYRYPNYVFNFGENFGETGMAKELWWNVLDLKRYSVAYLDLLASGTIELQFIEYILDKQMINQYLVVAGYQKPNGDGKLNQY